LPRLGSAADELRGRSSRLRALLAIQRVLAGRDGSVEAHLGAAAGEVRSALRASRAAIVLWPEGASPVVASDPPGAKFHPRSAVARAAATGRVLYFRDVNGDPRLGGRGGTERPVRGLVLPLDDGHGLAGMLAIEVEGDIAPGVRTAASEIALYLALVLENARLGFLQRRFTDELEGKVAMATRRLRELDRTKSELISVVSHELRTPLTAVQGFAELLLTREVASHHARRFLGHVRDEAERLGRIVTDLLDTARIEAGGALELKREPVDLPAVIGRNLDVFATAHPAHRFSFERIGGGPPVISGDPDAVDRILKNLLSNAVKYSPGGGAVRVSTTAMPGLSPMVELAVQDEGIGIPAEGLPRVFEKYTRLRSAATTGVPGLGLGLNLVRALAEAHGGDVSVESEPGRGSRFAVRLPA